MIAYKFRIYPNAEQEDKLNFALDICRYVYNSLLGELQSQAKIDRAKIQHKIVELKKIHPVMRDVYSKTLQYECYRLFSNLSALRVLKRNGKKVGRLRFKSRGWFKTINYNQSGFSLKETGKRFDILSLSKIGDIKILKHREIEGKLKQICIKKSVDKWYAILITDAERKLQNGDKILGLDLGINHFIADSEGNFVEHPRNIARFEKKLKQAQRELSRKKRGSHNRYKAKQKLAKIHEKIENCRNDFLHKLTTELVRKCKIIVVEDLHIKEMMQTSYNAKNMADASWGKFLLMLEQKVESTTAQLIKINPKNTTKTCSSCGKLHNMPLYKRQMKCDCGLDINRDTNSAINILKEGYIIGQDLSFVEKKPLLSSEQVFSVKQEAHTYL
ncbi:MAG: RNA-guided endonuclease TnpB family protein [Candidatus Pacearchaeota archaeon]